MLPYRFYKNTIAGTGRFAALVLSIATAGLGLLASSGVGAAEISLPLRVPLALLREPLLQWSALTAETPREIYREGPCHYFQAGKAVLEQRPDGLHFVAHVAGRWALEIAGRCIGPSAWSGTTDLEMVPVVGEDGRLRLRINRSTLRDDAGHVAPLLGFIVNLSKRFINARIEAYSYDLSPPRAEATALLHDCVPAAMVPALEESLRSLHLGEAHLEPEVVVVPLILTIPDAWRAPPPARPAAAPLDEAGLRTLEQTLEPLDAFLVFVIKRAGVELTDPDLRQGLFDLLLSSRYRLVDILSGEAEAVSGDPVRDLFIEDWEGLRSLIATASERGLIKGRLVEYALFLNAGDVLLAIDREAPGVSVEITADGLRRLARTLQPGVVDPLKFDFEVDPELRRLFDFGPDAPPLPPSTPPPGASWGERLLARLFRPLHAQAQDPDPTVALGQRLARWVPTDDQLADYQGVVDSLLRLTAEQQLQNADLKPEYAAIFRHLLPATALIESCWRQFVRDGGKVTFLKSAAGSIGMMQVNLHVWRGFYAIERLRWEVPYNIHAGAEILLRYMKADAIPLAEKSGQPDHVPRATYCVYNAGPKAVRRFLNTKGSARARAVDKRLWDLYRGIASGGTVDLQQCRVIAARG